MGKGARVVVSSDLSFRSSSLSVSSAGAMTAHYNELKDELDQKFQHWNDVADVADGLLKDCEEVINRWLIQMIKTFCDNGIQRFCFEFFRDSDIEGVCFTDSEKRVPRFERAAELYDQHLLLLEQMPQFSSVARLVSSLCNELVGTYSYRMLDAVQSGSATEEDRWAHCMDLLWHGLPLERLLVVGDEQHEPVVVMAERLYTRMVAMGESIGFQHPEVVPAAGEGVIGIDPMLTASFDELIPVDSFVSAD